MVLPVVIPPWQTCGIAKWSKVEYPENSSINQTYHETQWEKAYLCLGIYLLVAMMNL